MSEHCNRCAQQDCGKSHCGACCGGSCNGNTLTLTPAELSLLRQFAQLSFLPVVRTASSETPVLPGDTSPEQTASALLGLEHKGLIDIDYHLPLQNYDYSDYAAFRLHGSMALTARGLDAVEAMELQGVQG